MIKSIHDRLIWSNIPMALSAVGWFAVVSHVFQVETDYILLLAAFLITWFFYVLDRVSPSEADRISSPERSKWFADHKRTLKPILRWSGFLIIPILILRPSTIPIFLIGAFPCFIYAKKIRLGNYRFTLKDLPGIKVVLVALLWVFLIMGSMILQYKLGLNTTTYTLGLMFLFLVMSQIHINDIRDIGGDMSHGTKSFAALLGITNAKLLGISFICAGVLAGWGLFNSALLATLGGILMIAYLGYTKKTDHYWRLLIELQGVIVYVFLICIPQFIA